MKNKDILKWLLAFGALAIILMILAVPVRASQVYTNGSFQYTVEDQSVTIVSYKGTEEEVTVPNRIAGNPVNVIAKDAFARNKQVITIHLPDTITRVEEGAFGQSQKIVYDFEETKQDAGEGAGAAEKTKEEPGNTIHYTDKNGNKTSGPSEGGYGFEEAQVDGVSVNGAQTASDGKQLDRSDGKEDTDAEPNNETKDLKKQDSETKNPETPDSEGKKPESGDVDHPNTEKAKTNPILIIVIVLVAAAAVLCGCIAWKKRRR